MSADYLGLAFCCRELSWRAGAGQLPADGDGDAAGGEPQPAGRPAAHQKAGYLGGLLLMLGAVHARRSWAASCRRRRRRSWLWTAARRGTCCASTSTSASPPCPASSPRWTSPTRSARFAPRPAATPSSHNLSKGPGMCLLMGLLWWRVVTWGRLGTVRLPGEPVASLSVHAFVHGDASMHRLSGCAGGGAPRDTGDLSSDNMRADKGGCMS